MRHPGMCERVVEELVAKEFGEMGSSSSDMAGM